MYSTHSTFERKPCFLFQQNTSDTKRGRESFPHTDSAMLSGYQLRVLSFSSDTNYLELAHTQQVKSSVP